MNRTSRRPLQFGLSSLLLLVTAACFTLAQPLYSYRYTKSFMGDFAACFAEKVKVVDLGDGWVSIGQQRLNPCLFLPAATLGLLFAVPSARQRFSISRRH